MKFSDMKLAARLGWTFGLVVAATAVISVLGLRTAGNGLAGLSSLSANNHSAVTLSNAANAVWTLRWGVAQFLAVSDPAERSKIVSGSAEARRSFEEAIAAYRSLPRTEDELSVLRDLETSFAKYADTRLRWFELFASKPDEAAKLRAEVLTPAGMATNKALHALIEMQKTLSDAAEKAAREELQRARVLQAAISLIVLLLAVPLALLVTRSVVRQLGGDPGYATEVVNRVAGGDLATPIVRRDGDSSSLVAAMAGMQADLAGIVHRIKGSTDSISTASRQIAAGNADLSQRTEEQASSLQETASSVEELTGTVTQNADNARRADQLAQGASEVAVKGGAVVKQVVDTMSEISAASKKIAEIIGVIDGIAFQTNILALNAAVEAARAGEQGRGFAVVASEVRSLAQRCAAAAREIKTLIDDSEHKVESGARFVDEAGKTMVEIVTAVKQVTDIIAEISSASAEQATGIQQVNQAVAQVDQVTQQNAALVEEVAAATESLQRQAGDLAEAVTLFRLGSETPAGSAPRGAADAGSASVPEWDGVTERRGPDRAKNVARIARHDGRPARAAG